MAASRRSRARPAPPPDAARLNPRWLIAALLVLAAFALYWKGLHYPLVFDDRVLRDDVFRHYASSIFKADTRWFAYLSFGWTWELAGKQWAWHRALNVLLHAATAFVLFQFLSRLFTITLDVKDAKDKPNPQWPWIAAMGALLFLVHPVAVYGVAYLTQRSIVMATLFGLLSLWLFVEGLARRQSPAWFYGAAAAYFVAVFSKEHSVMIPAAALALTVLVRGPSLRSHARDLLLPFALMGVIAVFVTLRIKGVLFAAYEPFAQETLARMAEPVDVAVNATLGLSIVNQGYQFFHYLLVWLLPNPHWMTIDARPVFPAAWLTWPHTAGFAAWIAWGIFALTQLYQGGLRGVFGFMLLFPWLMALTEVSTLRVQEPLVLYRSYLWMCVLPALLPLVLRTVFNLPLRWTITAAAMLSVILVAPMQNRLSTFAGALSLWDDAVRYNEKSTAPLTERSYHNRGFAHLQARQYTQALADFSQAVQINPRDASAYLGRGVLYARTGSHELAVQELNRAIGIAPGYAEAYAKRCFVRMLQDNPPQALPDCEKAVTLNPRHLEALTNRGVVYAALDRVNEAAQSYQRALEIDGTNADAHYNFGVLHLTQQRAAQAQPHLKIACDAGVRAACDMWRSLK
jgi:protein O-mannosyl-transferase